MKCKAIVLVAFVLTSALALATDPPVYRHRLTMAQCDQLPLALIRHDTPEKSDLVTVAFHARASETVAVSAVHLVVRDTKTNIVARVEAKLSDRHGVLACIFRIRERYIQNSQIEFTVDLEKSYHPLMISIKETLDHFSGAKTRDLADLKKKEWNRKLLSKLNRFSKE